MRDDIAHRFEGDEVLGDLLVQAGCHLTVDEVREEFAASLEEDPATEAGEIIPLLFEGEPRFQDAATARRLYGNLLGLWDRVRAGEAGGATAGPGAPPAPPAAPARAPSGALNVLPAAPHGAPPAPEEGAVSEGPIPPAYVTWAWHRVAASGEAERRRAEDRLENRMGAVTDWVRQALAQASPEAEEWCVGLCVIAHEAFLRAYGPGRVRPPTLQALESAREADRADAEEPQPHLAAHQEDSLDEAVEDAEAALPEVERPLCGEVLAAVRRALTAALA